jgi:hypothetical protein
MDTQDIKILQKVGAAQREAFKEKFPGQVEHCMRLTAERLQAVLTKRAATDVADPSTWAASAKEIADLAIALNYLQEVQSRL